MFPPIPNGIEKTAYFAKINPYTLRRRRLPAAMLPRNLDSNPRPPSMTWEDLTNGVPTIMALARLCSDQLAKPDLPLTPIERLSPEAQAILVCARQTGSVSIRGDKNAFEPGERFLAICVEQDEGRRVEFRCLGDPEQTIRFMEGFRQLCCAGLVMHQLMNDFSLTARGFDAANRVDVDRVESLVQLGRDAV